MTEEQMKEYVVNGGKLFTIKTIEVEYNRRCGLKVMNPDLPQK